MVRAAERAARTSVWLEGKVRRGGRGGQPSGLDRERITEVTVRLLDAEGLAKFSMRRLAAELNVTAMSVYWYVDTKDDLLELALDAAFGELTLPDPDGDEDWRDQLRALAREYRTLLVRHPGCRRWPAPSSTSARTRWPSPSSSSGSSATRACPCTVCRVPSRPSSSSCTATAPSRATSSPGARPRA